MRESDAAAIKNRELLHQLIDELYRLRRLCKAILYELEEQGKPSTHAKDQLQKLVEQVNVSLTLLQTKEKPPLNKRKVALLSL